MAEELVLKPTEFQQEIDNFEKKNTEIGTIAYEIDPEDMQLDSVNKMLECVETMNRIITKFNALGQHETKNLQNIKSAWMNLDEEMGDTMLFEHIGNQVDKLFD